jgi:hypothetical protein
VDAPKVSFVMSVRDGQDFLAPVLESVLAQDRPDWELVALDDGSTDATWEILRGFAGRDPRIRPVRNSRNLGLAASLNRGLELARGELVARMDADDVCLPGRLSAQVGFMEANPAVVLLGAAVLPMDRRGRPLGPRDRQPATDPAIRWKMLVTNAFHHPTVMLRRAVLASTGLAYDESLPYAQDYQLWSRLLRHGRGANLARPLVRFRHHPGQASKAAWRRQQAIADAVAAENLARMGLAGAFSPPELVLLRRAGFAAAELGPAQRRAQVAVVRRFLRLARRALGEDPEWRRVERTMWSNLRRVVRHWPREAASLHAAAGAVLADPAGALADAAAWLAGRRRR